MADEDGGIECDLQLPALRRGDGRDDGFRALFDPLLGAQLRRNVREEMRRLALGVHLLAVADFNLHVERGTTSTVEAVLQVVADAAALREAALADLRVTAARGQWGATAVRSRALIDRVGAGLGGLLIPAAASAALGRAAARDAGAVDADWDRAAVAVGTEIASTLHLLAVLRFLEASSLWPEDADEVSAAAALPARSTLRLPPERSVRTLTTRPEQYLDTPVSVRGTVTTLVHTHTRRKAISVLTVTDEAGRSLRAELHGIKIDSSGIVVGAAVVLGGTWRREGTNEPVLMIDRHAVAGAADASWPDWLRNATRGIYQPAAHGLAASWSWEPGIDGPSNPIRYGAFARDERAQ